MREAAAPAGGPAGSEALAREKQASLRAIVREWTRLGVTGFGGPPTHVALLRRLCVERRHWLSPAEFEDAVAACNLLPGPASTQLAIFCARRAGGPLAGLLGGICFIVPGLILIMMLAALFLAASPPRALLGAGAGAGAAVAAVALRAGLDLLPASLTRARGRTARLRWAAYVALGALATAVLGPWVVVVLLGCGLLELGRWAVGAGALHRHMGAFPAPAAVLAAPVGGLAALAWVAVKVGALSYGGGFVIIPLMQADAVDRHHWLSASQFLDAVVLGQITPGPVVQTVAVVGYGAAGVGGGLLAGLVAFSPSFAFVLLGGGQFTTLRRSAAARAFLDGAGPAAVGAILGAAIPLALALEHAWQLAILGLAALLLLAGRRGVVGVLLAAGAVGTALALAGVPLPR
jgi:chromate transporter